MYIVTGLKKIINYCGKFYLLIITQYCFGSTDNFPIQIGQVGPIANDDTSRPQQYPFSCQTEAVGLGPPIDKDCGAPMKVAYYYKPVGKKELRLLSPDDKGQYTYPVDLDYAYIPPFTKKRYIVRIERGVINRFIYMIAVLEDVVAHKTPQHSGYENKAIYYFDGGSGLGNTQASKSAIDFINQPSRIMNEVDALGLGYAVMYSSGTATSTHYNLKLGLATAQMVKKQFISEFHKFGPPSFTIGLGGSGGAIQQLIYSQLDPTLLNGLILISAFPDLTTQINYAADCPLLEYYFDNLAADAPTPWKIRGLFEGMRASALMPTGKQEVINPKVQSLIHNGQGSDTCANGWSRTVHDLINPFARSPEVKSSLWDNESILWQYGGYPVDSNGLAFNILDNVGVQYGLQALRLGKIDKERFFDINAKIGGWKAENKFIAEEDYPFSGPHKEYDGWSSQNATARNNVVIPAPRKSALPDAIKAAKDTIFVGDINLPILEIRIDNDDRGDIHHAFESLVIRSRLKKFHRDGQHILWLVKRKNFIEDDESYNLWDDIEKMGKYLVSDSYPTSKVFNNISFPTFQPRSWPLVLMEKWIYNVQQHAELSVTNNKPSALLDGCYVPNAKFPIYFGKTAWDGLLDQQQTKGYCAERVRFYPTPRVVAGEDIANDKIKCQLIPVERFVEYGGYGNIKMSEADIVRLQQIFPSGVCLQ